jgi:hypothetical protein
MAAKKVRQLIYYFPSLFVVARSGISDPGFRIQDSGSEIRDPGFKKSGSRINIPEPQQ